MLAEEAPNGLVAIEYKSVWNRGAQEVTRKGLAFKLVLNRRTSIKRNEKVLYRTRLKMKNRDKDR
jgi:hypothetical protein